MFWGQNPFKEQLTLITINDIYQISLTLLIFLIENLVITLSLFIFARKNSNYGYFI